MNRVLITGTSKGIGYETALYFLEKGFEVIGMDKLPQTISNVLYRHIMHDIKNVHYPVISDIDYLINNAGVQNEDDINTNLIGTINLTEHYGFKDSIKSIVFVASASATTGAEFYQYAASKGGILSYMKNVANRTKATCNSISPGGVLTELNSNVINDKHCWNEIMELTPLKKWAEAREIAKWIYFIAVENLSMTGQDIIIDNGESIKSTFIWR